jgi:hypothetical protein
VARSGGGWRAAVGGRERHAGTRAVARETEARPALGRLRAAPQPDGPLRSLAPPRPRSRRAVGPARPFWPVPDLVPPSSTKQVCVCRTSEAAGPRPASNRLVVGRVEPGDAPNSVKDVPELWCQPLPEPHSDLERWSVHGVSTRCPCSFGPAN